MADLQSLGLRPEKGVNPQIQEAVAKDRMSLERPIPGESLTNNPDNPYPFEQAPEYTDRTDALEYLFATFVKESLKKTTIILECLVKNTAQKI